MLLERKEGEGFIERRGVLGPVILAGVDEVRASSREWRAQGLTVGLVPTMGALHAGHLSLVERARAAGADRVIVSIFVNPTQFAPGEDLASYPRDTAGDIAKLGSVGVDAVFLPSVETIYPPLSRTVVGVSGLSERLCGASRPHHFGGVATVVTMLLNIAEPDVAVFGEKDFQQLQIIRRLVADLHLPVRIVGAPIVREADGVAMSSRNAYLTPAERQRASALSEALSAAVSAVDGGERDPARLVALMRSICARAGTIDYVEVVDRRTLEPTPRIDEFSHALVAVQVGRARLIDNRSVAAPGAASAPDDED